MKKPKWPQLLEKIEEEAKLEQNLEKLKKQDFA